MILGQACTAQVGPDGARFLCRCGEWARLGPEHRPQLRHGSQYEIHCACGKKFQMDWFNMGENVYVRELLPDPPSRWQRFKAWLFNSQTQD